MENRDRIAAALLALRLGVFLVMLMWTLDKFLNAAHASRVFESFYGLDEMGPAMMATIGAAELLLIGAFLAGFQKRLSYGGVFILHAISTFSSYRQYFDPFNNLLFFAAWPMLAACFALYLLRDLDTIGTLDRVRRTPAPAR